MRIGMSATLDNKENLDADNYFLLAARTWDNKTEDYQIKENTLSLINN